MKRSFYLSFIAIILLTVIACGQSNDVDQEISQLQSTIAALENQIQQENVNNVDEIEKTTEAKEDNPENAVLPTAESLPTEPVFTGDQIVFDDWGMIVSQELNLNKVEDTWGIDIYLRNFKENKRIFRYMNASISAKDDLGNEYDPTPICPYGGGTSCEEYYYVVKNINIDGGDSEEISSGTTGNACMNDGGIHMFKGPIALNASQLIIHFENFGPFTDVDVIIEL